MISRHAKYFIRFLLPLILLDLESGCASRPHLENPPKPEVISSMQPNQSAKKKGIFSFFSPGWSFFHHRQAPPKALALQRVGIIRTLSADSSFVIIELEPGVLIPAGRELLVMARAGEPIHLRAAESQPPYFIADIKSGQPMPGQIVFQ